ncbi:WD-40 repeat-containing protein [Spraguea lophii 42_110]|uniref:WD-40 repeat-containing protein n=1 Tax=Spraguea lophii (strain 42_110) TaxID=1358809 RepID=S7XLB4_SPRLO|nr:WD-40 repeat-containing protein [Spraguea lophii 42_110]
MSEKNEILSIEQQTINEEYKLWRSNVPYLYDVVVTHSLRWPSLSVQWFPDGVRNPDSTTQRLLLSTHTSEKDDEFIEIVSVTLPDTIGEKAIYSDNTYSESKIKTMQSIEVLDEINRTRYCPQMNNLIATRSDRPNIHIYDTTKHLNVSKGGKSNLTLKGHKEGGYGLSWNPNKSGELISSGEDGFLCLFDINKTEKKDVSASLKLTKHTDVVGDCCFNFFNENSFGSVGDDKALILWDKRNIENPIVVENAHNSEIYSISFSPLDSNFIATGGKDSTVKIWDARNLSTPLHTLLSHKKDVVQIQWSPHYNNLLASSGNDRRVIIWDLNKIGAVQTQEDSLDGPPELLFLHGGHTNTVCDFSWNPLEPYEIASVAEDNILQIWQMSREDDKEIKENDK